MGTTQSGRQYTPNDLGTVAASAIPASTHVTDYYAESSYLLAKGHNIVNVILVDFRAIDTMVEVTVLSVAAVGVYALLHTTKQQRTGAAPGCERFNGITDIQDYAVFGLRAGIVAHLSKYATLTLGADLNTNTRHFVTSASRGVDLDGNGVVDAGSQEVNPVRRDVVDNVGRRYLVDDVINVTPYFKFLLTF